MADPVQQVGPYTSSSVPHMLFPRSDPGSAPSSGAPGGAGARVIDPARLKAMRENVVAKYAGTQEALERNREKAEGGGGEGGQKQGLRAQHMEGIVKHHDD